MLKNMRSYNGIEIRNGSNVTKIFAGWPNEVDINYRLMLIASVLFTRLFSTANVTIINVVPLLCQNRIKQGRYLENRAIEVKARKQALACQFGREAHVSERYEVGAFYWTVLAPDIVNSRREEQGSISV
jgi:hypothetical protein